MKFLSFANEIQLRRYQRLDEVWCQVENDFIEFDEDGNQTKAGLLAAQMLDLEWKMEKIRKLIPDEVEAIL